MELTVEELVYMVKEAVKKFDGEIKKGRDGYPSDEKDESAVQPSGFSTAEAFDHSQTSAEGNRIGRQGQANFGPYTESAEKMVRAVVRNAIHESFEVKKMPKKKLESSAPFNKAQVRVGAPGSVGNSNIPGWKSGKGAGDIRERVALWYEQNKPAPKKKNYESNIMGTVFEARQRAPKRKEPKTALDVLSERLGL